MAEATLHEPEWLAARRERAASLRGDARPAALQGRGGLGVHRPRQARPRRLRPRARGRRARRCPSRCSRRPRSGITPDPGRRRQRGRRGGTPDGPTVMALDVAAQQHPELVEPHLGTIVPADDIFVAANDAGWAGGAFVYVPRGVRGRGADPAQRRHRRRRHRPAAARADRARGGRRGRGLGAVPLRRRRVRDAAQHRRRARRRAERQAALRLRPGPQREVVDLRRPARRGRSATASSTGSRSASAPRAAACGWRPSSPARAPRRKVTGAYAPHAPPARRLRHDAGARGAAHVLRPRLPRHPLGPLDARSGAA